MADATQRRGIDLAIDHSLPEGRIPPQAVEIEEQILGAMLLEKEAIPRVIELMDEDAFHSEKYKKIFQAIVALFDKSEPADSITVAEELRRRGQLESVGGEAAIIELTLKVTSAANVEYHTRIVVEKALMRKLIGATSSLATRAFDPTEDAFD